MSRHYGWHCDGGEMKIETMLTLDGDDGHLRSLLRDLSGLVRVAEQDPTSPVRRSWGRIDGNAFSPRDVRAVLDAARETSRAMRRTARGPCPFPATPDAGVDVCRVWAEGLLASADLVDRYCDAITTAFEDQAPGILRGGRDIS